MQTSGGGGGREAWTDEVSHLVHMGIWKLSEEIGWKEEEDKGTILFCKVTGKKEEELCTLEGLDKRLSTSQGKKERGSPPGAPRGGHLAVKERSGGRAEEFGWDARRRATLTTGSESGEKNKKVFIEEGDQAEGGGGQKRSIGEKKRAEASKREEGIKRRAGASNSVNKSATA